LVRVSARIGCISFGGPAGQIAIMHREFVDERQWIDEPRFLAALNLCHLLPGPEAQQLAIYIGWRLHGLRGGLAAGLLFVIPGALVMLGLSTAYALAAGIGWIAALFLGVKAAVIAVVVQALLRVAGRALDTGFKRGIAVAAFVALFVFSAPFPLVVLAAGAAGALAARVRPAWLALKPIAAGAQQVHPTVARTIGTMLVWAAIWAAPLLLVLVLLGPDHVLLRIGLFFSKLAIVTFGGAYAVLAYMAQQAVSSQHWLTVREMADGLGLAETTPGPLILVTQHVGFLAAFRAPGIFSPFVAGLLGAVLTTWVTFAPCFLWIFTLAPWMDKLQSSVRLKAALAAVTAAVVGVIGNLTVWFALNVLFARTVAMPIGQFHANLPVLASFDWRAALLAAVAAVLLFKVKLGMIRTLGVAALGGLALEAVARFA
jgi:chromate transporter